MQEVFALCFEEYFFAVFLQIGVLLHCLATWRCKQIVEHGADVAITLGRHHFDVHAVNLVAGVVAKDSPYRRTFEQQVFVFVVNRYEFGGICQQHLQFLLAILDLLNLGGQQFVALLQFRLSIKHFLSILMQLLLVFAERGRHLLRLPKQSFGFCTDIQVINCAAYDRAQLFGQRQIILRELRSQKTQLKHTLSLVFLKQRNYQERLRPLITQKAGCDGEIIVRDFGPVDQLTLVGGGANQSFAHRNRIFLVATTPVGVLRHKVQRLAVQQIKRSLHGAIVAHYAFEHILRQIFYLVMKTHYVGDFFFAFRNPTELFFAFARHFQAFAKIHQGFLQLGIFVYCQVQVLTRPDLSGQQNALVYLIRKICNLLVQFRKIQTLEIDDAQIGQRHNQGHGVEQPHKKVAMDETDVPERYAKA